MSQEELLVELEQLDGDLKNAAERGRLRGEFVALQQARARLDGIRAKLKFS